MSSRSSFASFSFAVILSLTAIPILLALNLFVSGPQANPSSFPFVSNLPFVVGQTRPYFFMTAALLLAFVLIACVLYYARQCKISNHRTYALLFAAIVNSFGLAEIIWRSSSFGQRWDFLPLLLCVHFLLIVITLPLSWYVGSSPKG